MTKIAKYVISEIGKENICCNDKMLCCFALNFVIAKKS
jgi:hypothetical protein